MNRTTASTLQRSFYAVGLLLGVVAILYTAHLVLVPLALAVMLAFILTPIVEWLERRGLPRSPAVGVLALLALVLIAGAAYVVTLQFGALAVQLQDKGDEYRANVTRKLAPVFDLMQSAQSVENVAKKGPVDTPDEPAPTKKPPPTPVVVESQGFGVLSWLPAVARPVLEVGAKTLLVVVLAIFMLLRRESMRDRMLRLLGQGNLASATRALDDTERRVSRYLLLQLGTNAVVGLGVGVGLYFIGVPYAVLWGVLAGALRFIPYIGVWLAAALPFGLSMALFPGWTQPVLVLVLFLALEMVMFNAVEPLLFGHGTGVSPVALLVAAVFWAWLWGPAGLLLSTPLTVCLAVLGRHVPGLRFLDVLLGERPALDTADRYYQRLLAGDLDEACTLLHTQLKTDPVATVCDGVALRALARARLEQDENELNADEERKVLHGTRMLLNSALAPTEAAPTHVDHNGAAAPLPQALGCPAQGTADALGLQMLRLVLRPAGCELKLVSPRRLIQEVQTLLEAGRPAVVCFGTLPPGGTVHVEHLCRRVHAKAPAAKLLVGRWGRTEDASPAEERLHTAGAASIGATLGETADQVIAALGLPPRNPDVSSPPGAVCAGAPAVASH